MENKFTIEQNGMLKILECLYVYLRDGKQEKSTDIRHKIGIDLCYWVVLTKNDIIKQISIAKKPIYKWIGIKPNIYMAVKLLKEDGELNFDNQEVVNHFEAYPLNINKEDLGYCGYNEKEISIITQTNNKQVKEINIPFEIFWNMYDKKVGDKHRCEKLWKKLKDSERQSIIEIIPRYICQFTEKTYQPYPTTFLNERRWENEIIPTSYKSITVKVPVQNKSLNEYSPQQLWDELKRRGYYIENNQLMKIAKDILN